MRTGVCLVVVAQWQSTGCTSQVSWVAHVTVILEHNWAMGYILYNFEGPTVRAGGILTLPQIVSGGTTCSALYGLFF